MKLKNPKYFMAIGIIFYIAALGLFGQTTTENIQLMIPATLCFSIYITFYWMIRHWFFSVNADYTKIGKQISTLTIIRIVIGFLAPIVGGVISFLISFNVTFILGAIAGVLSLIPIFMFYAPPHPRGYDFKKVFNILKKPDLKAIRLTYIFEAFTSMFVHNVWVLVFAIFIGNIMRFGLLVGFTTLMAAMLSWWAGSWFDQRKRKMMLTRLTYIRLFAILLYTTLFFYPHMIWVTAVELINRLTMNMHITIGDSYLFAYSSKIHPIHFHLNREVHLNIGRLTASALLAVAFYFLPAVYLWVVMGIGAFCILGFLNLKKSDHLLH
ncbi:hypothetical protein KKA95_04925 [Patescibacteria group bacterium]|nr:hypothetical protein [Patescibacteria group bacterium]